MVIHIIAESRGAKHDNTNCTTLITFDWTSINHATDRAVQQKLYKNQAKERLYKAWYTHIYVFTMLQEHVKKKGITQHGEYE